MCYSVKSIMGKVHLMIEAFGATYLVLVPIETDDSKDTYCATS